MVFLNKTAKHSEITQKFRKKKCLLDTSNWYLLMAYSQYVVYV